MKQTWKPAEWLRALKTRRWAGPSLVLVVALCGALVWAFVPRTHTITVEGLGAPMEFLTTEQVLSAAFQARGIELGPKDLVYPPLNTSLKGKDKLTVEVQKATPVTVYVDGKTLTTQTQADTVSDVLRELEVTINPKDGISLDPAAGLTPGAEIRVVRRTEKTEIVQEEIPYDIEREEDRTMMAGETKELQAGESGIREIKKVTYYEDGQEVKSEVIEDSVVKEPVNQIVAYGTGGVVSRGGRQYRYVKEMTLEATGYTAGKESNPDGNGYTYTGMKAVRGIVAVDPRVIPLYTRVYVEGYGPALAADIGGAIKGNKIDLCFDDLGEALAWGRRSVTVYILDE